MHHPLRHITAANIGPLADQLNEDVLPFGNNTALEQEVRGYLGNDPLKFEIEFMEAATNGDTLTLEAVMNAPAHGRGGYPRMS